VPRRETQRRQKKYLTMNQLRERWGNCSHMSIERWMQADPDFPRPMRLGGKARVRLWDEAAVEAYERASVAAR
jgi:predicted DNA-binding transcriptional regulator AlpA